MEQEQIRDLLPIQREAQNADVTQSVPPMHGHSKLSFLQFLDLIICFDGS